MVNDDRWTFATNRLGIGPWHDVADRLDVDLAAVVSGLLTDRTTVALPEPWRGNYSTERAQSWITDRDGDSSTLLVVETKTTTPIGLLILAEVPAPESGVELRLGYLLAEGAWGRGLATELVSGLIEWASRQPRIRGLAGGTDPANQASRRVLEKCGFSAVAVADPDTGVAADADADSATVLYRYEIAAPSEWDSYAADWDGDSAARAYAAAAYESLREVLKSADLTLDRSKVIDFGCGTGLLTEHLVADGAMVDAIDTSAGMLEVVAAKISARGWTGVRTSTTLPDDDQFDVVVCSSVCSFLDDYPGTVTELVARLGDGGLFVQWDWERTEEGSHGGLSRAEIHQALDGAGLVEINVGEAFEVQMGDEAMAPIMGHGRRPKP